MFVHHQTLMSTTGKLCGIVDEVASIDFYDNYPPT